MLRLSWAIALMPALAVAQTGAPVAAPPAFIEQLVVEATFPGPAGGTVIQRVRDLRTGVTCYLYLPAYLPPAVDDGSGAMTHGPNSLGSISCVPGLGPY